MNHSLPSEARNEVESVGWVQTKDWLSHLAVFGIKSKK